MQRLTGGIPTIELDASLVWLTFMLRYRLELGLLSGTRDHRPTG